MKIREKMWLNGRAICFSKKETMRPGEKLKGRTRLWERWHTPPYATRAEAETAAVYLAEKNGFLKSNTSSQRWYKEYEV